MKKNYINPVMTVSVLTINATVCAASDGKINKNQTITNAGDFGAKGRGDDHESDGWSDGLW